MVFIRVLISLVLIFLGASGQENQDIVPCDEGGAQTSTIPASATTPSLNEVICGTESLRPFKRKNGWWCMSGIMLIRNGNDSYLPMPYAGRDNCQLSGSVLSSLESEEEWAYFHKVAREKFASFTGLWVGVKYNAPIDTYFWNDGFALPTIEHQPEVIDPNGKVAWILNRDANVSGYGSLQIVKSDGRGTPAVHGLICGRPGIEPSHSGTTLPSTDGGISPGTG